MTSPTFAGFTGSIEAPEMDKRFSTWKVRILCRTGALKTVARELGKYELDLVVIQEVRWEKGGTERAEDYIFFCGEGNEDNRDKIFRT
jgi:hypothetical protein